MQKYKPNLPPIQEEDEERNRNPRIASIALKQAADEMQQVQPYKTIKRGEPPIRTKPNDVDVKKSTLPQRKRNVIHALCRVDSEGNPPKPSDQKVPAYNGFHASISKPQDVTKAHYVKSYDKPPNKSVVNDIMETQKNIMRSRNMPFSFLVGDLPVFNLLVEIKAESPNAKFDKLNPFLSPWHCQCVMMATIFKRYKGSELEEILVQAGVIGPGSVEPALAGNHYRRGMRCLRLFSENLMRRLTKGKICMIIMG